MAAMDKRAKKELEALSKMKRVWDCAGGENVTPGLIQLCRDWLKPTDVIAEIGCFAGVSTAVFACFVKKVIAVDPFMKGLALGYNQISGPMLAEGERLFNIMLQTHPNVQHMHEYGNDASKLVQDASLDAVYIDGWHIEPAFRQDMEHWLPKLKPGGLLMGHDWGELIEGFYRRMGLRCPVCYYEESSWVSLHAKK
jgi:SAM-dependent methyltransferase